MWFTLSRALKFHSYRSIPTSRLGRGASNYVLTQAIIVGDIRVSQRTITGEFPLAHCHDVPAASLTIVRMQLSVKHNKYALHLFPFSISKPALFGTATSQAIVSMKLDNITPPLSAPEHEASR